MITLAKIETYGMDAAFRGMRNPMNSWEASDSKWDQGCFVAGEKDLTLARNLIAAGTDESKFMRQIGVSMDITAPLYW